MWVAHLYPSPLPRTYHTVTTFPYHVAYSTAQNSYDDQIVVDKSKIYIALQVMW